MFARSARVRVEGRVDHALQAGVKGGEFSLVRSHPQKATAGAHREGVACVEKRQDVEGKIPITPHHLVVPGHRNAGAEIAGRPQLCVEPRPWEHGELAVHKTQLSREICRQARVRLRSGVEFFEGPVLPVAREHESEAQAGGCVEPPADITGWAHNFSRGPEGR